ncbi:MAG: hypothetical protein LBF90_00140 [Prevotellaceae bacterium]|nr:hypothetical protein [Prevotellaceae bacterium]
MALCVAAAGGLFYPAGAQSPAPRVGDVGYLSQSEAWLGSENAAGLQSLPAVRLSSLHAFLHKGNGGFVNYHESDNSVEAGAAAESYYRLNTRVAFYGNVHYGHFTGRNMGGSAWIDPGEAPFDLVEAVDTNRGTKNLERYCLSGAMSVRIGQGLSLGGRIDYRAANYAKFRDLRHVNTYSDIALSAGAVYAFGAGAEVGLSYLYRYSAEAIVFNTYGNTDRQYRSLISFGGFFGRIELYDDTGTGYTTDANPLFNEYHGIAVQGSLRFARRWRLFVEASGKRRGGLYGKRGAVTPVHTEHEGADYALVGVLSYRRGDAQHQLKVACRQTRLENFENVFRKENTLGNRTEIVYYARNIVRHASRTQAQLVYTGWFGIDHYRPTWRIEAGANGMRATQTISQYPYYRNQRLYRVDFFIGVDRLLEQGRNEFVFALGGVYGTGGGIPQNDGLYAPPSSTQKPPRAFDGYLYHEFDYLASARVGGHAEGTYARRFHPGLRTSVSLRYACTHALHAVRTPGNLFHFVSLSVGCTF